MFVLIGIPIVILGFMLKRNPLLVVTVAGLATGLAAGLDIVSVIAALGKAFVDSRYVAIVWLVLPVIGLLEHAGLRERARDLIAAIKVATAGRLLVAYLAIRQVTAAFGLTSLGGQAQMVRPLVAPMAEAAGDSQLEPLPAPARLRIRALAAATDNIGIFFGEDIFIAIGSILLIKGFLDQNNIPVEPAHLALWAIPTAIVAFIIHATRLLLLDRQLARAAPGARAAVAMITLEFIYLLMGLLTGGIAVVNARDATNPRRANNTVFWGIYSVTFLFGSHLPNLVNGFLVIAMVLAASIRGLGQGTGGATSAEQRAASARRWGNRLFIPALAIPVITLAGTLSFKHLVVHGSPLVDPRQVTQIALGIATLVALALGMIMLRAPARAPILEARRLMDSVGWAAVLPQMLASLGALFALADVGRVVATLTERYVPLDHAFAAVATYTVGMAIFTMIMGNAFAAFPVMTAGIGLPIIVGRFGGNVEIMAAIGMLSGFCGTLMTPMAANFNIVPVALLELPDQYAVIKAQVPTAVPLLLANTLLMYFLVFRF